MKHLIALAALGLAGCKTLTEPVEVPVPTPVACVDPSQIPPEPPTVSERFNGDAKHDLQILAPSAQALRKWGQDLRALLDNCVEAPAAETSVEAEAPVEAEAQD